MFCQDKFEGMINIIDLKKQNNENERQYIWRLASAKDSGLLDMTWEELSDVLNDELREEDETYNSSAYRKPYQQAKVYYEDVFSKMVDGRYSKEIQEKKQEMYKERQKLLDEKTDFRKLLRDDSRLEHRIDLLEEELKKQGLEEFKPHYSSVSQSDNDLTVMLSDLHIGSEHYSFTGMYNSDIAKERLEKYLGRVIEIKKLHDSENCFVTILGDNISGSIHKSIAVANREDVIEQTKLVSELICSFVFELSKHFNQVYVNAVSGNHSRLERKEDARKDERLDSITPWFIKHKLDHVGNIYVELDEIDSTIAAMSVRDKTYISLHGDYDAFTDSAVAKLVLWLGFRPDVIMFGHKHHPAMGEVAGITTVQCGSLAGSGDDYTIQKRLKGRASQTILVCDTNGVRACYPVKLD